MLHFSNRIHFDAFTVRKTGPGSGELNCRLLGVPGWRWLWVGEPYPLPFWAFMAGALGLPPARNGGAEGH